MEEELIVNKVANSGIVTINLEDFHDPTEKVVLDIKPWLFREAILKEADFRESVKTHDWSQFEGKIVVFNCSADAIIPTWAYMLLAIAIQPFAKRYFFGNLELAENILFSEAIAVLDYEKFKDLRVMIKGCGNLPIPTNAFVEITAKLLPYAKSIMYGEACSNVPLYKR